MRTLLTLAVVAALAAPGAASAQYAPIATDGSVPYGYGHQRYPWYFGLGAGWADGDVTYGPTTYSFYDWHNGNAQPTNWLFNLKVGATLSPALLLGFDFTTVGSQLDDGVVLTRLGIDNFDAVATWFPAGEGFFLKGGLGVSQFRWTLSDPAGSSGESYGGTNALVGLGYALWLGYRFNLVLNADYSVQWYRQSALGPDRSSFFAVWLGFDWY
jgi:opacity protein-like surface antigen